jgi:hypothetical protein
MVNAVLPKPAEAGGDDVELGRENETEWAAPSSALTAPTYKAAEENNETTPPGPAFWRRPQ